MFSAQAAPASAPSPLEVSGALVGTDEDVQVRVFVRNTTPERLRAVRMGGDLLGRHAQGTVGDIEPGQVASALLTFPYASEWRPGRHVLPLAIDYESSTATGTSLLAYLVLPLATSSEPAVRVATSGATLDLRTRLPVRLESADGQPHRARVRVLTPPGLVAPSPPPVVDVPAHGGVTVQVTLLRGAALPGSRHGILLVAETLEGPVERMAVATSVAEIAPAAAWLPPLRAPLLLGTLVLLVAGGLAEARRSRS